ncbi:MAG: PEP-CTERM sorting domain-containing protein [Planctomycetota bacterium]
MLKSKLIQRNVTAILICLYGTSLTMGVDLFDEDFESLTLQPIITYQSELRSRSAWTDVPPEGWTVDNSNVATFDNPNSGVVEFEGWRFVDKEWWITTAGGQRREEFLNATGIVAVADPDEWDDFGTPRPETLGFFDAKLTTPAIDLSMVGANEAKVFFHSSWRDEEIQKATLTAYYDDPAATTIEILRWDSAPELADGSPNPNFKDDAPNEGLTYDLLNPSGANSVQLEFRVFDAENNWWWSFDNLKVFTGDGPAVDGALRTIIDRDTGNMRIVNATGEPVDIRGYSIQSSAGSIDEQNATFLSDADPTGGWLRATIFGDDNYDLSEVHLSSATLEPNDEIDFGNSWINFHRDTSDISFEYLLAGRDDPIPGIIEFIGNGGESYDFLDLNYNGEVEIGDWIVFKDGFGTDLTGLPEAQRYNLGDLDNDGLHTHLDFIEFERIYDSINGAGSFAADLSAIPEPGSMGLMLFGGMFVLGLVRRKRVSQAVMCLPLAALLTLGWADSSQAQLTLMFEDFEGVPLGPNVEEGDSQQEVWTDTPPAGWTISNDIPGDINDPTQNGVREWYGWSFTNKDWWNFVAGDQRRSEFTRGLNTVLVADGDEWDDADGAIRSEIALMSSPTDFYDTTITTASIPIPAGIPAGRIQLAFDSSWRDEAFDDLDSTNNQTGTVSVRYDGGSPIELLRWDSDPESDFFHDDNCDETCETTNERITLDMEYDGSASSVQIEFGFGNAWNDWWWAVDNVLVSVPADPSILVIDPDTGAGFLDGGDVIPVSIKSLDIQSANGTLLASATGLSGVNPNQADGPDPGDVAGDSPGEQWEVLTATENRFFEAFLFGKTEFDSSRSESMGILFDPSTPIEDRDITFSYSTGTGDIIQGIVRYESRGLLGDFNGDGGYACDDIDALVAEIAAGTNSVAFDMNGDGQVNLADRDTWLAAAGNVNLGGGKEYLLGDANLDGVVDVSDFNIWNGNKFTAAAAWCSGDFNADGVVDVSDFNIWNGNKFTSSDTSVVPEQQSLGLAMLALLGFVGIRKKPRCIGLLLLIALTASSTSMVSAQTLDRWYRMGDDPIEGAIAGGLVASSGFGTRDSEGEAGMNQRIHLLGKSRLSPSLRPMYVDVSDRPDGITGLAVELNPLGAERAYLHTGFTEALNFPERSPSSIFAPGGTIDFTVINDRGFQLWAKPTIVRESHIVMDTNQHGVLIDANNNFAMRYAEVDYGTSITPVEDTWYHLSVVRPFGPNNGSIFYVNGVAEAAAIGQYNIEFVVNEDTPSSNIGDLDTSPLVVGASTGSDHGLSDYFSGVVDDLEMFVMGLNGTRDFGEYEFVDDNGYAKFFKPSTEGDIDGDDTVTLADANLFADNWLRTKELEWTVNDQSLSLIVGDLQSRDWGDFNYDGIVDLADWAILNNQNPAAGARAWDLINGVPEPDCLVSLMMGLILVIGPWRRRFSS